MRIVAVTIFVFLLVFGSMIEDLGWRGFFLAIGTIAVLGIAIWLTERRSERDKLRAQVASLERELLKSHKQQATTDNDP